LNQPQQIKNLWDSTSATAANIMVNNAGY